MASVGKKCADVYSLFFETGEVTEIRAYGLTRNNKAWEGFAGGTGIVYGYFDEAEAFGQAAEALDAARAGGIYFTLNPVIPDLLARAKNRLVAAKSKSISTSDKEIACIRWLPVDLDPIRPSGISSTDEELKSALRLRNKIIKWMIDEMKFEHCIAACSGNGGHAVFRLAEDHIATAEAATEMVRAALKALAEKFTTKKVDVDGTVFNASRIWKVYGTTTRKGDHTETRPHRKCYIEKVK